MHPRRLKGRLDPTLALMVGASFAAYSALSIIRHETFRSTGFDLALFEQVIGHYSRLEAPSSAIKGLDSIFKDHVAPVMALLGPWYAIFKSAASLLVAQAALIAASAIPVYLYAERRVDRGPALMLTGAYLLFGGVQEAVWIDIHEVAFAPLLIGGAVVFADRGRWGWSFAAAVALLAVKEDMSFVVAALGIWYLLQGQRKLGVAAIVVGIGWILLVTEVLVPGYGYWRYSELGATFPEAVRTVVTAPWTVIEVAIDDPAKLKTTAYLFGAFLGLSLLSPLAVLTLPLLAERLLSDTPALWTLESHYSLTIAPVLALAAADGLRRLGRGRPQLVARIAAAMLAIAVVLTSQFPLSEFARPSFYSTPTAYRAADEALATIPSDASVAASNHLAPQLDGRPNLTLLTEQPTPAQYVIAALGDSSPEGVFPHIDPAALKVSIDRERQTRRVIFERDAIVVLGP